MSKLSKTARASMGQQAPKEVKVIPDAELIRLLRIDRASGIFATCQGADAALRTLDILTTRVNALETDLAFLQKQYANAQELAGHSATAIERLFTEKSALIDSLKNANVTLALYQMKIGAEANPVPGLTVQETLNLVERSQEIPLHDQVTGTVEFVNEKSEVVATGVTIGLPYLNTPGDLDATNGELPAAQ